MEPPQQQPLATITPADFVQVGVVVGAHGYDGRLRIQRETDNPQRFRRGAEVWVAGRPRKVQRTGGAGDVILVKLAGVDSKEDASTLLHEPVMVPLSAVPPLPEDSYYHYELIGMSVVSGTGEDVGTLSEVISTGANDVYVVFQPGRELLVPAIGDVVSSVDTGAGRMTVNLPEGLEWRALNERKPPLRRPRRRKRPVRKPPPA